jgi:hypothetical protein
MPEVLDRCFWIYRESTPANLSPNRSLAVDLIRPFRNLWLDTKNLLGRGPGSPSDERRDIRQHSNDYHRLRVAGDAFLADPSIDFLLLHMPIPHPYGFYDRKKKAFSIRHTFDHRNATISRNLQQMSHPPHRKPTVFVPTCTLQAAYNLIPQKHQQN